MKKTMSSSGNCLGCGAPFSPVLRPYRARALKTDSVVRKKDREREYFCYICRCRRGSDRIHPEKRAAMISEELERQAEFSDSLAREEAREVEKKRLLRLQYEVGRQELASEVDDSQDD